MRLRLFAAATAMLVSSLAAHADTVFSLSGSFTDGAQISGTLTINTVAGTITGSHIVVGAPDSTTQTNVLFQGTGLYASQGFANYGAGIRNASGTEDFNFVFPTLTLVGYTGTSAGAIDFLQAGFVGNLYDLTTSTGGASLGSPVSAATPEPSSLALLGTGVLGVIGAARRRFAA